MVSKIMYDKEADSIYIELSDKPYAYSKELDPMRHIDYAPDDTPIAIELLRVSDGVNVDDLPNGELIAQLLGDRHIKVVA